MQLLNTASSIMCRSFAQYCIEVNAANHGKGDLSKPIPAHLPPISQLVGSFPQSYSAASESAVGGLDAAARRSALGALLQRRGVAGPEGKDLRPILGVPCYRICCEL